jgi:hypothetical protein
MLQSWRRISLHLYLELAAKGEVFQRQPMATPYAVEIIRGQNFGEAQPEAKFGHGHLLVSPVQN